MSESVLGLLHSQASRLTRRFSPPCDSCSLTSVSHVTPTSLFVPGPAEPSQPSHTSQSELVPESNYAAEAFLKLRILNIIHAICVD